MSISSSFLFPLALLRGVSGTCDRAGSLEERPGCRKDDRFRGGVLGGEGCCKEDGPASGPCAIDDDGKRMLFR